jgi:hypothetical protein
MSSRFKLTVASASSPGYKRIKSLKEAARHKFSIYLPPEVTSGLLSSQMSYLDNDSVEAWIDFDDKDLLTQKMTLISNGIVDGLLEFKSQIDPSIVEEFVPDFMSLLKKFILSDPYVNIVSMEESDFADIFGFR